MNELFSMNESYERVLFFSFIIMTKKKLKCPCYFWCILLGYYYVNNMYNGNAGDCLYQVVEGTHIKRSL